MTPGQFFLNLLFALLAFFLVRWLATLVFPEDNANGDRLKIVNIVALLVAIVVFFANFASQIITKTVA